LASKQAFHLAQACLGSTGLDNTDIQFMDNPVIDPFAIVTDHHNSSMEKNAQKHYLSETTVNDKQQRCCHKP
jgi:hypothetical protein